MRGPVCLACDLAGARRRPGLLAKAPTGHLSNPWTRARASQPKYDPRHALDSHDLKILVLTLGSRGDVQPYVALGQGLRAAGHDVSICTSEHFAAFITAHGLDYRHMNNGFVDLIGSMEGRAAIAGLDNLLGTLRVMASMLPRVGPLQVETLQDAWCAAQAVQPDLILFHPKIPGAVDIADALGVPVIMAPLFPQYVATGEFPTLGFPALPFGAGYRRGTYHLVHWLAGRIGGGPIRRWRCNNAMAPRPAALGLFTDAAGHPIPVLHGYSTVVSARPTDWPETAVVAGAWSLAAPGDWLPQAALLEFLAAGPPPVYVGFGSMAGRDPTRVTRIVLEALRLSGRRGLLALGWGGLDPPALPPDVMAIDQAPHDWLFPQVAAVVHHGGAGTTEAALRAGKPSVVCPFFGDQPFWGRRVHTLGAGPAPIPQKRLTAGRLAAAIREAATDPSMSDAAEALGRRLRREHGVASTVRWIERWMAARVDGASQ